MHVLLLRSTLLRAVAVTARTRHACGWQRMAVNQATWNQRRCTGEQGKCGAHRQLHAVGPLLEQHAAATLSEEICSYKCRVFDVPSGIAEDMADILMAYGAQSVSIEEFRPEGATEQQIFAVDGSSVEQLWDRCTVVAYFPPEADALPILETVKGDVGLDHHRQSIEAVRQQDWEECIRGSYQPKRLEPGLWIVPIWSSAPDPRALNIILEPGLAFGTGDHPTTRLCLRWLRQQELQGRSVMDYGTGSGILAVAALLMGAELAVATDVEPLSIKAAEANAAHNRVAERLAAYQCSPTAEAGEPLEAAGLPEAQRHFDVVVANILKGPLISLAPRLSAYAKPGAALGLSGILAEQVPAVIQAYSPFFESFSVTGEDQWALIIASRKATQP